MGHILDYSRVNKIPIIQKVSKSLNGSQLASKYKCNQMFELSSDSQTRGCDPREEDVDDPASRRFPAFTCPFISSELIFC